MPDPLPPIGAEVPPLPAVGAEVPQADTSAQAPPESGGGLGRLLSTAWEEGPVMGLVNIFKAAKDPVAALNAAKDNQIELFHKAKSEYDKGNYEDAAVHAFNGLIPLLGPKIDELAQRGANGDWSGAIGGALGVGTSLATPDLIKAAPSSVKIPGLGVAKPAEAAATARAAQLGVPIDAATATMNPVVRAAQYGTDRTLIGSKIAAAADEARAQATAGAITKTARRTSQLPETPETAGAALQKSVTQKIGDLNTTANAEYSTLRAIEAKHPQVVQIGQRVEDTGVLDASGNPITRTVPITKQVNLPVNVKVVKDALRPIEAELSRQLPITQAEASPGLKAIRNILEGDDVVSASTADADLGAIKGIVRKSGDIPALRGVSAGLAAQAADRLSAAVDAAVAKAGPQAQAALKAGRDATRAKYMAGEVLGSFADEPVKAFNQATLSNDAGIGRLRALRAVAPTALPKLGRAYLDDLVDTATADGGFAGQKAWSNWQKLGPQTKNLLFQDKSVVSDLDAILSTAKRAAMNPNPSGTAHTALMYGELGHLVVNPATGIPLQIAGGLVAKLMRSPAGIKALRDGLTLPLSHPLAKAALQKITQLQAQTIGQVLTPIGAQAAQNDPSTTP